MPKKQSAIVATEQDTVPHPALRDHNFVRLSVDGALAAFLGHDVMLTLYARDPEFRVAPNPKSGGPKVVGFSTKEVEVACIRMAPAAARAIATNIFVALLQFELAEADDLKAYIDEIAKAVADREPMVIDNGN